MRSLRVISTWLPVTDAKGMECTGHESLYVCKISVSKDYFFEKIGPRKNSLQGTLRAFYGIHYLFRTVYLNNGRSLFPSHVILQQESSPPLFSR